MGWGEVGSGAAGCNGWNGWRGAGRGGKGWGGVEWDPLPYMYTTLHVHYM